MRTTLTEKPARKGRNHSLANAKQSTLDFNDIAGWEGRGGIRQTKQWVKWAVIFPGLQTEWFSDLLEAQTALGKLRRNDKGEA